MTGTPDVRPDESADEPGAAARPPLPIPAAETAPAPLTIVGGPPAEDSAGWQAGVPASAYPRPEAAGQASDSSIMRIFGDIRRSGPWTVPERLTITAGFSDTVLDLREATVTAPEVVITSIAAFGDVKVIVPHGVAVDLGGGLSIFGDDRVETHGTPAPGAYRLRLVHHGLFSDARVVALAPGEKPPKWWKRWW